MKKQLVLGNQVTLYVGVLPDIHQHRHSASALCAGINAPIRARSSAEAPWKTYDTLFIPSGVDHALSFNGQPVVVLFFEEQSAIYRDFLIRYSLSRTCLASPAQLTNAWRQQASINEGFTLNGDILLERVVQSLLPDLEPCREIDQRVQKTIGLMQSQPDRNFSAAELACHVHLSPSRLSALFASTMGLPLRRYRVWLRLRSVASLLMRGTTLTEAAVMAGFTDSAHFSNSCRKLLGIKPTDIISSDGALQILFATRL
jgi:AraC-like DNA-binding protein